LTSSGNGWCHQKPREKEGPFEATTTKGSECWHSWDYMSNRRFPTNSGFGKQLFAEELYLLVHCFGDVVLSSGLMYQFCRPFNGKKDVADLFLDIAEKLARP
jgi:hypothetical protein